MGLLDDEERRRRLTRFYLLNGYFDKEDQDDEDDVFLTPEIQTLKDLGVDIYDFEFMGDNEKLKLLQTVVPVTFKELLQGLIVL